MGGTESSISESGPSSSNSQSETSRQNLSECKVWRNPLNLFRGAEYRRYTWVTGKEPLTYYDMNLSAQDHQTFFTCDSDFLRPSDTVMQKAWRERNPPARIKAAYQALELNNDCATAYVLLAEEEATTIVDAERLFKQALKAGETIYRRSQQCQHQSPQHEAQLRRDTNVLVYIKRRLAMCARKLGRIREAVKIMRDLMKEFPPLTMLNIHENLLESLLELQAYADVQAVLAKYDDISLPKSAAICYTAALLKTRTVSDKFSPETASRRGLSTAEINAVEAIHRAVEFNPHVPKYLLEMKSLILPPEHILKRGDSEAIAYAFFHLQHWKRIEGALNLLQCTWEGTFRMIPYPLEKGHLFYPYPSCTETADRELLPTFHHVSVYPKKELPFFIHFTAGLCSSTAMIALLTHQFPEIMGVFAKAVWATWLCGFVKTHQNEHLKSMRFTISQLYLQLKKVKMLAQSTVCFTIVTWPLTFPQSALAMILLPQAPATLEFSRREFSRSLVEGLHWETAMLRLPKTILLMSCVAMSSCSAL
ncbi:suppressor of tumorigenicity 7 protein-like isoform X16 [Ictidomys tridecemlineatus]|nr:suppressor of tumorigenicity 7 protein-like isoform X13 [Ictidomys tridecemlineatus]XP_040143319.1 suppressor of tumorigenicity 7 protein-like isoform X13 [Ictidomys tridecemlineatus]XP_040143320.1 suppressor of tumorigenicity 7 protein-like isoform X13 [Ictidomys tridecemlineatus]XP_040143321.1 suppressor of tumorigenicity 7 protein-like isoform X13 [Ictidomys tridecemlineatus]XP_040143323.1 suppressor of tumorigenicity 7 protein-like isoform X13 [Ictidomys tridecemlineatus]